MKPETQNHIIKEQFYQADKWKDHYHTVGEWLLILKNLLEKANNNWMVKGDKICLYEILQLAASAITCLDDHSDKVSGREFSKRLALLFENHQDKTELPTLKCVDLLIMQIEHLQKDFDTSQKENTQNKKKIKDLEQKIKELELQIRENKEEDPFPWPKHPIKAPPYIPPYIEPVRPSPYREVPHWDPKPPGWPYCPTFTCDAGHSRKNQ